MGKRTPIVHIEWRSRDAERLKQFYKQAFHWKLDESSPGYALAHTGNKSLGAGIMQIENGSSVSPGVVGFLGSDDLIAAEEAVREAGGQVLTSAQAVPGWGRFSLFTDPDGNRLGLWQSERASRKADKRHEKHAQKQAKAAKKEAKTAKKEAKAAQKAEKKAAAKAEKKAAKAANPPAEKKKKKKAKAENAEAAG